MNPDTPYKNLRKRDAAWALIGVAGGPVAGLLVAAVALRIADEASYGLYSLAMSFLMTAAIFGDFGISHRVIPWIGSERGERWGETAARLLLGLVATGTAAGIGLVLVLSVVKSAGLLATFPSGLMPVLVLGTAAQTIVMFTRELRRGLGDIRAATLLSAAAISSLNALLVTVFLVINQPLDGQGLTLIGVASITLLALVAATPILHHAEPRRQFRSVPSELRSWFKPSLPYGLNSLIATADGAMGLWIIGALATDSTVLGSYAIVLKLGLVFALPQAAVAYWAAQHLARSNLEGEPVGLIWVVRGPLRLAVGVTALGLAGAALVGAPLVDLLLGAGTSRLLPLVLVVGVGHFVGALAGPGQSMLLYSGYSRLALASTATSLVVVTAGGLVGMFWFGLEGVVAAVVVAWLTRAALETAFMQRRLGWSFAGAIFGAGARTNPDLSRESND